VVLGSGIVYSAWILYWAVAKLGLINRDQENCIERLKAVVDSFSAFIIRGVETVHGAYPGRFSTSEIRDFELNPEITKKVDEEILADLKEKGQDTCAICLGNYELEETISVLPNCDHVYHDACVVEWIKRSGKCPLCRSNIRGAPGTQVEV